MLVLVDGDLPTIVDVTVVDRLGSHVSQRWAHWRATVDLDEYFARWDHVPTADSGHGEADFIHSLQPDSVLDAGCGMGRLAIELHSRGIPVVGVDLDDDLLSYARRKAPDQQWVHEDLAIAQFDRQFHVVAMPGNVMIFCRPEDRRAVLHTATQHLVPNGMVVAGFAIESDKAALTLDEYDQLCSDCDLTLVERWSTWDRQPFDGGNYAVSVHRRSDRFNVHDMLFEARSQIVRLGAVELADLLSGPNPPTVIDTRTSTDRSRFGVIPGSVHVPRTVLEWHLDPANGYRHPTVSSFDQQLVIVCNGGYSSSVAAAGLKRIGYRNIADLRGGVHAWALAGLPLVSPDHSHLDTAPHLTTSEDLVIPKETS